MKRYFKLYLAFIKNCLIREIEFRSHFILHNLIGIIWAVLTMATFIFIYQHIDVVNGWTLEEMLLLTATWFLFDRIFDGFFEINFRRFTPTVTRGWLDYILTRPISAQFYVSFRRFSFTTIFSNLSMVAVIVYLLIKYFWPVSLLNILSFIILFTAGMAIVYSLWFSSLLLVFWLGRVGNIEHLFRPVYQISRIPINITGPVLKPLFTYFLPLAFVATLPVTNLISNITPGLIVYGIFISITFLWLSHRLWLFALKYYSSASS